MPNFVVESFVSGRTGRYDVRIRDTYNPGGNTNLGDVELMDEVVIRYGDTNRTPLKQVLKSYVVLNFVDRQLNLHDFFKGSFDPFQYIVEIVGPDVEWRGQIKEETRRVPFTNRTKEETTQLRCFGGVDAGRFDLITSSFGITFPGYALETFTSDLKIGFDTGERLRSDIELLDFEGNTWKINDPNQDENPAHALPVNMARSSNAKNAVLNWAKTAKGMFYRELSSDNVVYDVARLIGTSGPMQGRDPGETLMSPKSRPQLSNRINIDNLIVERGKSGFQNLAKVGKQIVKIQKGANLGVSGAISKTSSSDSVDWIRDRDTDLSKYNGTDKTHYLRVNAGSGTVSLFLGELQPLRQIGIVVTWKTSTISNSPNLTLKYRGNSGATFSESSTSSVSELEGDTTSSVINPVLEVSGGTIDLKIRYIDATGRIVEELTAKQDKQGTEDIEFDLPNQPLIRNQAEDDTREAKEIRLPSRSISNVQAFIFRTALTKETRPFRTRTAVAKITGLYGPEYVHALEVDGTDIFFVSTGLKCNIKTGLTEVALVEVPNHAFA